jgi:glucosylceramidase
MKDNNAFDKGNMKGDAQTLEAHALYLSRWVEAYEEKGIHMVAIAPQNEPGFAQDYPSCIWSGAVFGDYIANHLGPMFEERGIAAKIWLATMSNTTDAQIVSSVMGNSGAAAYVEAIGLQWGMVEQAGNYSGSYDFPIIQTEHKCGNYPWMGGDASRAPNDFAYGVESWGLLTQWIEAGVSSYNAWNMVLDTVGRNLDTVRPWAQNALLVVDRNARSLTLTPTYYVFRHLSYFVDPGAVRIGTSGGDALAFKNPDGSIATVLRTSGSGQTTVSAGGRTVQFDNAGDGWATVFIEP